MPTELSFRKSQLSLFVFLLLAALLLLPSVGASSFDQPERHQEPTAKHTRSLNYPNLKDPDLLACETPLAGDLYGLGVRLGIYFNWFTAWVASNFIPDEMSGTLDTNAIFLLAIAISASRSLYSSEIMQIDALILLELCAGTIVGVLSLWGYRTCWYRKEGTAGIRHFGGFGTHLRLLLATAVAAYSVWFWSVGLKGAIPVNDSADPRLNCDKVTVLTLNVHGPVKYIALALASLSTIYCGTMLLASSLAAYTRITKVIKLAKQRKWASSTRLRYYTGLNDKELHFLSKALCVFNILWIIFAMLFVELTLNQNKVRGVLGENGKILEPAQLLPMLIGAFSFVRILFIGFELWRNPHDIAPSLGHSGSHRSVQPREERLSGVSLLKLFSPALADDTSMALQKPRSDILAPVRDLRDEYSKDCNLWQRILIAWLPWISLLHSWPLKDYKGLPVTETDSAVQAPEAQTTNEVHRVDSRPPDDDDDEKPGIRVEKGQETENAKENDSPRIEIDFSHPQIESVHTWSPVDRTRTGFSAVSVYGKPVIEPQAAHFEQVPLDTPVSPIHARDFQRSPNDDYDFDPISPDVSYERMFDLRSKK